MDTRKDLSQEDDDVKVTRCPSLPVTWLREYSTRSGYFALCDECGTDIEGIPARFVEHVSPFNSRRRFHPECEP